MSVQDVTPDAIVDAMVAAGWQVVGERAGIYKRLAVVDGDKHRLGLLVPLDPTYSDYDDSMGELLASLEVMLFDGQAAQQVLNRIQPGMYL